MTPTEMLRLARFFASLAIKEHFVPGLHVRPLVAELFLTENCNLRCRSCACWRTTTRDELTTVEWQDVLRQLVHVPIHKVNFTGGEPLIRSDALQLMAYAREIGIRHTHLNTNAILLTPAKLDGVLSAGVRSFNVSVDGPRAVHDRIRGREGAFEITVGHLKNLVRQRDKLGLKLRMNFTVMRDNLSVLPDMVALAQDLRVNLVFNVATDRTFLFRDAEVSRQTSIPEAELAATLAALEKALRKNRRWLPRYSDIKYIPRHFADVKQRSLPCTESQLKLMIHSRGEIGGCWGHDPDANVRDRPILDVVDDRTYRQQHARLFRKDCVGCGSNYSVNLRWRPATYVDDLRWRLGITSLARG